MSNGSKHKPEILTKEELMSWLKLKSIKSVYYLVEKRKIPFFKLGGQLRFNQEEVLSCFDNLQIEPIGLKQNYGNTKR